MPRLPLRALALLLALTLPGAALADLLDRYRTASEAQAASMAAFMTARVPDLAEVIPPPEWSPEAEAVGVCTLDAVLAARGADGLEAFVGAVEAMAAIEITSMEAFAAQTPPLLAEEFFLQVSQDCGAMDLAFQQMQDSGMLEMMQRPEVMEALMAP